MLNKVILIGRLGANPETRFSQNGSQVTTIRLATTRMDKKDGQKQEETEWHRVVFYQKLAEVVSTYLKKGDSIYLEGRIKTKKWQDNNGLDRYTTEIIAETMNMLGGKNIPQNGTDREEMKKSQNQEPDYDLEIPF